MAEDTAPGLTGIHHFSATVTDIEAWSGCTQTGPTRGSRFRIRPWCSVIPTTFSSSSSGH